jgi:hypothetical protein
MISIIFILLTFVLVPVTTNAGVVINQRTTFIASSSPGKTRNQTIMLQGDQEKFQIDDQRSVLFDTGKQTATMLDKASKTARELPLTKAIGAPTWDPNHLLYVDFKSTDRTRELLGFKCREYNGAVYKGAFTAVVNSCFSTDAAGAGDFSQFMKSIVSDLGSRARAISIPPGVPLMVEATFRINPSFAPPGLSADEAFRLKDKLAKMPPRVTRVEVTKITPEKLSPEEFDIPAGYTRGAPPPS